MAGEKKKDVPLKCPMIFSSNSENRHQCRKMYHMYEKVRGCMRKKVWEPQVEPVRCLG